MESKRRKQLATRKEATPLGESTVTTTANAGAYTIPIGQRVDNFLGKYKQPDEGEEGEKEGDAVLKRNF